MLLRVFLIATFVVFSTNAAPKSRNKGPQLVYDQKQKGEHNIQVHLKDFQIIALLGGDSFGGDYDYNYDYSDFTVKPGGSSSTTSSPSSSVSTSTLSPSTTSTLSPSTTSKLIENTSSLEPYSTTVKPKDDEKIIASFSSEKPTALLGENDKEQSISSTLKAISTTTQKSVSSTEASTMKAKPLHAADAIPGQIQVQILESPEGYPNFAVRKDTTYEEISRNPPSGKSDEKKCLTGFVRDKKGRCRRIRRPQSAIPFDFGRLAHLAARFKSDKESLNKSRPSAEDSTKQH